MMTSTQLAAGRSAALIRLRTTGTNFLLSVMFAFFAYAAFLDWQRNGRIQALILVAQELLIVGLVITRRGSTAQSRSLWDWAVALIGTGAPLLLRPGLALPGLTPIGIGLQILSALLATVALGSLGRSFGIVAANRGIRTSGLYRFVRHPLYGSYLIGYVGFLAGNLSMRNVVLIAATSLCHYLRAVAEERILLDDPEYRAYAASVSCRFIPHRF